MEKTLLDLQLIGFKIQWVLADREYYCQEVLDLVKLHSVPIITPAKEYKQLKEAKWTYLSGKKGRIQQFLLG